MSKWEQLEPYSDEWIEYVIELEKERWGISSTFVPEVRDNDVTRVMAIKARYNSEIAQLEALQEQRDKIMFNAGRFVAGARDDVAVSANRLMEALLESGE